MMLKPQSTWTTSPVIPLDSLLSITMPMLPTSSASRLRRSGEMAALTICILSKSPTPLELTVRSGPALMALTRVPDGPSSLARYRTQHSSAALQIPIRL